VGCRYSDFVQFLLDFFNWNGKNKENLFKEEIYLMPRDIIILECEICKQRNYTTTRNKRNNKEKLSLKKYCKFDRKHTVHKEVK